MRSDLELRAYGLMFPLPLLFYKEIYLSVISKNIFTGTEGMLVAPKENIFNS